MRDRQRKKLLQHCKGRTQTPFAEIKAYLDSPLVPLKQSFLDTEFLVLDFETTGLDPVKDEALSLGYTVVQNGRVKLKENRHFYFRFDEQIPGESVAVHQITETRAREGLPREQILSELFDAMRGRVLVAHFSRIEESFINKLVRQACQWPVKGSFPLQMIDTLKLAYRLQSRISPDVPAHRLRLFNLRADLGLPRYKAHDALVDAVSTAELLLVQVAELYPKRNCMVTDLL